MPQEVTAKKTRAIDAETAAIAKIGKIITNELQGPARQRVLDYIHARYCLRTDQIGS